jgi:glycosyltransferase involved in cell wall biosynthesis
MWESARPGWFPEEYDWVLGCTYRGMLEGAQVRNLIGANMSFRRDVLNAAGGFNPGLGRTSTQATGAEETGACIRASQLYPSGVFIYASRARVEHRVPASRTTWRYFRERCYGEGISKAQLSRLVGSHDGLSSERKHTLVTIPTAVGRALGAFVGGDRAGLARAGALVAGLAYAGAGYAAGRIGGAGARATAAAKPAVAADVAAQSVASAADDDARPASPRRLRVLMVTPRYFPLVGGVEHHVSQVAHLMAADADVTVLTTDTTGELPATELVDGVQVTRVRAWPRNRDYYFAPAIYGQIVHGEWDIVHVQSYHTAVAPIAMLAALRANLPYVLTFHGGGHSSRTRESLRGAQWAILRPLLVRARRLIAVAEFEAERFSAALRVPRERIEVIPNGSDLPPISAEEGERLRAAHPNAIVSVGRLERYKGHDRVIEAMPVVLRELPDATLRVIGTGPYQPQLEALVERLGLGDSVTIGAIPPSDRQAMAAALAGSALFVLMSEFETHPLAVIEALALGRPALVADTSGLAELARTGVARAIPLDTPTAELAEAILCELRNPQPVPDIAAPTWQQCAERILGVYREVLSPVPLAEGAHVATRVQGE